MVKKANEEARRRAISRPPAAPTRAPAKTDQRMVVGGYAAGAGSRPPPLPSSILQRGKAAVQKRQQVRQAPKFVAQPVRAAAPAPRVQATAPPVSSRPIVEKVSSIAQTNSARTNLAGEKRLLYDDGSCRRRCGSSSFLRSYCVHRWRCGTVGMRDSARIVSYRTNGI